MLDPGEPLLQFQVVPSTGPDPSRIPDKLRDLPPIDLSEVRQERLWVFDYDGGLWTINGKVMDPNRIDAGVEQGSAEIWTFRNSGNSWSHPVHCHFTEFLILEINGQPYRYSWAEDWQKGEEKPRFIEAFGTRATLAERPVIERFMGGPRRDVATLLPGDEIKVFMRFRDFLGKYVMHCHNVVHEDHSMMIRWDIVEPGQGFLGSRPASQVYGTPEVPPHLEERPASPTSQADQDGAAPPGGES
jgi:FtsP/CotA-like multicopper oxidase with cupredoxin domain